MEVRVENVEEAIALAKKWQGEGKYDWFQGQLQAWPPSSSLERRIGADPVKLESHIEFLNRFVNWAKTTPGLEYLAREESVNSVNAILQHYGFPTCYVDFTTSPAVAGFFSADHGSSPQPIGSECVIYCLNTEDLSKFYKSYVTSFPRTANCTVEPITVDVSNLWRLEAQRGHFLYTNHAWYKFYHMDRIVFPWTGYPAFPGRENIYPEHKSHLENTLDHFFLLERRDAGHAMFDELQKKGCPINTFSITEWEEGYDGEKLKGRLDCLPSWDESRLQAWAHPASERLQHVRGQARNLRVRDVPGAASIDEQICLGIQNALADEDNLRDFAVDWAFTGLENKVNVAEFTQAARAVWNGMRKLPYTDDEICKAMSNLLLMSSAPSQGAISRVDRFNAARHWSEDTIEVEFSNVDGASSRAFCSRTTLHACIVPELGKKFASQAAGVSLEALFVSCYNPKLMFEFEKFRTLFANEIVPSQVVLMRPAIIFNPALLKNFGRP